MNSIESGRDGESILARDGSTSEHVRSDMGFRGLYLVERYVPDELLTDDDIYDLIRDFVEDNIEIPFRLENLREDVPLIGVSDEWILDALKDILDARKSEHPHETWKIHIDNDTNQTHLTLGDVRADRHLQLVAPIESDQPEVEQLAEVDTLPEATSVIDVVSEPIPEPEPEPEQTPLAVEAESRRDIIARFIDEHRSDENSAKAFTTVEFYTAIQSDDRSNLDMLFSIAQALGLNLEFGERGTLILQEVSGKSEPAPKPEPELVAEQTIEQNPIQRDQAMQYIEQALALGSGEVAGALLKSTLTKALPLSIEQVQELLYALCVDKQLSKISRKGTVYYRRYDPSLDKASTHTQDAAHKPERRGESLPVPVVIDAICNILTEAHIGLGHKVDSRELRDILQQRTQTDISLNTLRTAMRSLLSAGVLRPDYTGNRDGNKSMVAGCITETTQAFLADPNAREAFRQQMSREYSDN